MSNPRQPITTGAGDAPLDDFDWTVRTEVYAAFRRTGAAPMVDDLVSLVSRGRPAVVASLQKLHRAHEIATPASSEGVWMAHPFSAVRTDYPVQTSSFVYYANCAWDALGIPAILGADGWTTTRCAGSGVPLEFGVVEGGLQADPGTVIHLLTPLRHAWADIGFT